MDLPYLSQSDPGGHCQLYLPVLRPSQKCPLHPRDDLEALSRRMVRKQDSRLAGSRYRPGSDLEGGPSLRGPRHPRRTRRSAVMVDGASFGAVPAALAAANMEASFG